MLKFKKVFSYKIIIITASILFAVNRLPYAYSLTISGEDRLLRVPLGIQETYQRIEKTLYLADRGVAYEFSKPFLPFLAVVMAIFGSVNTEAAEGRGNFYSDNLKDIEAVFEQKSFASEWKEEFLKVFTKENLEKRLASAGFSIDNPDDIEDIRDDVINDEDLDEAEVDFSLNGEKWATLVIHFDAGAVKYSIKSGASTWARNKGIGEPKWREGYDPKEGGQFLSSLSGVEKALADMLYLENKETPSSNAIRERLKMTSVRDTSRALPLAVSDVIDQGGASVTLREMLLYYYGQEKTEGFINKAVGIDKDKLDERIPIRLADKEEFKEGVENACGKIDYANNIIYINRKYVISGNEEFLATIISHESIHSLVHGFLVKRFLKQAGYAEEDIDLAFLLARGENPVVPLNSKAKEIADKYKDAVSQDKNFINDDYNLFGGIAQKRAFENKIIGLLESSEEPVITKGQFYSFMSYILGGNGNELITRTIADMRNYIKLHEGVIVGTREDFYKMWDEWKQDIIRNIDNDTELKYHNVKDVILNLEKLKIEFEDNPEILRKFFILENGIKQFMYKNIELFSNVIDKSGGLINGIVLIEARDPGEAESLLKQWGDRNKGSLFMRSQL